MAFKKGESGNKSGRPVGIVDKRSNLRLLLEPHAEELVTKAVELALSGEVNALRLCIERIIPRIKPDNGINFDLPEGRIDAVDNMLRITNDITKAVATGQMTIEEAEKFTEFLKHQCWQIDEAERQKKDDEWKKERGW